MHTLPVMCLVILVAAASRASAEYTSIQHNLFNTVTDTTFDHTTGQLHIHAENTGLLTLNDPVALPGIASNIIIDIVTTYTSVDENGVAQFAGGTLLLTFDYDPTGAGNPSSYMLGGPVDTIYALLSQTGPTSRIDFFGEWFATVVSLPGSGIWPGFHSFLDSLVVAIVEDLSDFNWDRTIAGRVESLYFLSPNAGIMCCCVQPERFVLAFNATTQVLRIEDDTASGWGFAYADGQCFGTYILETQLQALTSDGAAFFTGGVFETSVFLDTSTLEPWYGSLQGQTTYLWLTQVATDLTVKLSGEGRWDPTETSVTIPWPDDSGQCGFDGLSHLGFELFLAGQTPPTPINWTSDWNAIAYGVDMELAPQECPAPTCTYPFGDMDLDCDVDLLDFAAASRCITGTASLADLIAGLRVLDADGDLDLGLDDFTSWSMTGPMDAPASCCSSDMTAITVAD